MDDWSACGLQYLESQTKIILYLQKLGCLKISDNLDIQGFSLTLPTLSMSEFKFWVCFDRSYLDICKIHRKLKLWMLEYLQFICF